MTASAADLPPRYATGRPSPVLPVFSWTGFYIGGHVGGAWTDDVTYTAADPFNTFGLDDGPFVPAVTTNHGSGVVGGLQLGSNWQIGPSFLVGVESDISGADVNL